MPDMISLPQSPPTALAQAPRRSWFRRFARQRVINWLSTLESGTIHLDDSGGPHLFGISDDNEDHATWKIADDRFYSEVVRGGSLGMAESYLRGDWHADDLTKLLSILYRNERRQIAVKSAFHAAVTRLIGRLRRSVNDNTIRGSRRNIAAHYDLSNEFFELFLDPTLMYSSAFFEHDGMSLHDASIAKLKRICQKLDLQPSDHVLETGTGWGGFALHALRHYDVSLTTTTISAAQLERARNRFAEAGLDSRIRLLDVDYRKLTGQYDKLVSIEMVEAVGERFLDTYFRQCGRLLKPGGRFVLQAIVMPEQRYDAYRRGVDFIQKYIFPGGFLPSLAAMAQSVGRTSNLRLREVEDISPHYVRTLREWRTRFMHRLEEVRQLGFDDRFIRMWEYYLCYCEVAFREQAVRVVQIVWDKPAR
ncbi:MAG: cyclopropane-fatty-acyl-phospholipid synthase family protein [Pirellulaceae bacterium]|nr:class I SAM-dependent methyltransferase [Planctomycetales bacterium]